MVRNRAIHIVASQFAAIEQERETRIGKGANATQTPEEAQGYLSEDKKERVKSSK